MSGWRRCCCSIDGSDPGDVSTCPLGFGYVQVGALTFDVRALFPRYMRLILPTVLNNGPLLYSDGGGAGANRFTASFDGVPVDYAYGLPHSPCPTSYLAASLEGGCSFSRTGGYVVGEPFLNSLANLAYEPYLGGNYIGGFAHTYLPENSCPNEVTLRLECLVAHVTPIGGDPEDSIGLLIQGCSVEVPVYSDFNTAEVKRFMQKFNAAKIVAQVSHDDVLDWSWLTNPALSHSSYRFDKFYVSSGAFRNFILPSTHPDNPADAYSIEPTGYDILHSSGSVSDVQYSLGVNPTHGEIFVDLSLGSNVSFPFKTRQINEIGVSDDRRFGNPEFAYISATAELEGDACNSGNCGLVCTDTVNSWEGIPSRIRGVIPATANYALSYQGGLDFLESVWTPAGDAVSPCIIGVDCSKVTLFGGTERAAVWSMVNAFTASDLYAHTARYNLVATNGNEDRAYLSIGRVRTSLPGAAVTLWTLYTQLVMRIRVRIDDANPDLTITQFWYAVNVGPTIRGDDFTFDELNMFGEVQNPVGWRPDYEFREFYRNFIANDGDTENGDTSFPNAVYRESQAAKEYPEFANVSDLAPSSGTYAIYDARGPNTSYGAEVVPANHLDVTVVSDYRDVWKMAPASYS